MTGMSVSRGDQVTSQKQVCHISLNVIMVAQLSSPGAVVAVRVNPPTIRRSAVDLDSAPPTVTLAAGGPNSGSAAELLATGTAARAIIIQSQPLGVRNQAGVDMYALMVTIPCDGFAPSRWESRAAEWSAAAVPGPNLPAKVRPGKQGQVIVDWEAAVAEATRGVAN
jgi:hypothetical protein